MASWQDGPEYAPTVRPSAFVEPVAVPPAGPQPGPAIDDGVPGLEPSFVPPEQPTPDLRALVPSAAPGRNPNLPFESATTPLTSAEEAVAPRSPLQPFTTGGPSLAGYLPAQPVVQPNAQVNPATLPMSMAQQWAPPAPATRVQGSVPVTVRQIWQATTGWVLVPLVVGRATPAEVAGVLEAVWGGAETLIVISSDLSHFLPYEQAQEVDQATVDKVLALQDTLTPQQACGGAGVNGLIHAARSHGLQPHLLQFCNSGDTAGDKARVVGYAAFLFTPAEMH